MPRYITLSQPQRARLRRLLRMEYTPRELADDVGCGRSQIIRACEAGCPYRKTASGRCYVVGCEFASWYESLLAGRKHPLSPGEAYCLHCRSAVRLVEPEVVPAPQNGVERVTGRCPQCGSVVNRFRRAEG